MTKLTKQQRKDLALKEYEKIEGPAWKEYEKIKDLAYKEYEKIQEPALTEYVKKCEEIDAEEIPEEIPEVIEQNGRKYKRIK